MSKTILISVWALMLCGLGYSQGISLKDSIFAGDGFIKARNEYMSRIKRESPELYEMESRVLNIHRKIRIIVKQYMSGEIDKDVARNRMAPLIKERLDIYNSDKYKIEQELLSLLDKKSHEYSKASRF